MGGGKQQGLEGPDDLGWAWGLGFQGLSCVALTYVEAERKIERNKRGMTPKVYTNLVQTLP